MKGHTTKHQDKFFSGFQIAIELIIKMEERKAQLLKEELQNMPEGHLQIKFVSDKPYFLQATKDERHSITQDLDLVYKLARKRYIQLKLIEHNNQLKRRKDSRIIRMRPLTTQIRELLERYQSARLDLTRITLTTEQYHWVHQNYPRSTLKKERIYKTYSGIEMRSKSERDIGNEMELEGVPYRYEEGIEAKISWMEDSFGYPIGPTKTYYPDFRILTATGEIICWEHLGLLYNYGYRERTIEKISAFRQGGYLKENQLIITVEKDLEDLNFIRDIIAEKILPYV